MATKKINVKQPQFKRKKGKPRVSEYESNAQQVLEYSLAFPGVRALRAMRIETEIKLSRKNGRMPTSTEIEARHNFTPEAAKKFLAAMARAMHKAAANPSKTKEKAPAKAAPATPTSPLSSFSLTRQEEQQPLTHKTRAHLGVVLADIRRRFEVEIRTKGEQTLVKEGFAYLATHPSFEGWVKVGMTIDYELRLGTYNTADPLSRFVMPAIKWVPDRRASERQLLSALAEVATEMRGEWARMPIEVATQVFEAAA
jgi:hypothetical protein